jgi:hypothetical protein
MTNTDGITVITGRENIDIVRLLTMRRMLKLECEAGIVLSRGRSLLAQLKREGIVTSRTKRGAYAELDAYIVAGTHLPSVPLRTR